MVTEMRQGVPEAFQLSDVQRRVLEHLRLFRITTTETVNRLFLKDATAEGVKSFLGRLMAHDFVASADLIGRRRYYYLTANGVRTLFDEDPRSAGPFTPRPLVDAYGVLAFCTASSGRRKLHPLEFARQFPTLVAPGLPQRNYYVDAEDGERRIGFIAVDQGAQVSRIAAKVRSRIIGSRVKIAAWRTDVIDKRRFVVAVVTTTEEKAAKLREALSDPLVSFRVEVVPEILAILDRK